MVNYAKYQISFKVLLEKGGKFLILKDNDDVWDLPGGRTDTTETHLPASKIINREIEEELGKDLKYRLKSPITQFTRHISKQNEPVMIIVFEADYISGDIKLSKEHGSCEWIDPLKVNLIKKSFSMMRNTCFSWNISRAEQETMNNGVCSERMRLM